MAWGLSLAIGLALSGCGLAQNTTQMLESSPNVTLIGCPELGCPRIPPEQLKRNWDVSNCTVGGTELRAVGIAREVFSVPGNDTKLSLTVARTGDSFSADAWSPEIWTFTHTVYLGKPAGFDLRNPPKSIVAGCALFWQHLFHPQTVAEYQESTPGDNSTGCNYLDECYDNLFELVRAYEHDEANPMPRCEALAWHLTRTTRNPPSGQFHCPLNMARWGNNITGVPILGPDAPATLADSQGTTNCRPVLPPSNEMVRIADQYVIVPNYRGNKIMESEKQNGLDGITPSLSVIYMDDNTTSVQVACMRTVGNPPYPFRNPNGAGMALPAVNAMLFGLGAALWVLLG